MGNMMKKASETVGHEDGDFQQDGDMCDHVQSTSPEILYTFKKDELRWEKSAEIASKRSEDTQRY